MTHLMSRARWTILGLLALYSIALVTLEMIVSQDYVRTFFTDFVERPRLYGINTIISVSLLFGTALTFVICLMAAPHVPASRREKAFYWSQVAVFAYLGLDDRLTLHEWIGQTFRFNDAYFIVSIGVLEVLLLWRLGGIRDRSGRAQAYIAAAALFALAMIVTDGWIPREMSPRLSVEDLSKTWSAVFLLFFAIEVHREQIIAIAAAARDSARQNDPPRQNFRPRLQELERHWVDF